MTYYIGLLYFKYSHDEKPPMRFRPHGVLFFIFKSCVQVTHESDLLPCNLSQKRRTIHPYTPHGQIEILAVNERIIVVVLSHAVVEIIY